MQNSLINIVSQCSHSFAGITCDVYTDSKGETLLSRKQVGESLEYADPNRAIEKIHRQHRDRLDGLSTVTKVVTVEGGREITRETFVYSMRGVLEICRWSRQQKANALMDFVWDIVESSMNPSDNELSIRVKHIEEMLTSAGILRPFVAPRYTFENLTTRYKQATGRDRVRDFYDDIGDYFGIKVPYSDKIHITVRDWILQRIPLETIQEMVVGFETHLLTRSDEGHLVSLNGCFGNTVEWDKVLREFDHKCAYCGDDKATLIAEHIVPQSVMSKEHPELTDSIFNIVPTCSSCNKSKGTHHFPSWYKKQSFYSDERYWKILKHISKYHIGNTESIV